MARQGQRQFGLGHAAAVIDHADQGFAAIADGNIHPRGTRIDGVFHQLFHRRCRPFNHLARGDAVDGSLV